MNNEPVAWIGKNELQFGFTETTVTSEKESWDDIPLYTHPAKTLTDEEIEELKEAVETCDYKYFGSYEFSDRQWKAFEVYEKHIKEILRKAQEKC